MWALGVVSYELVTGEPPYLPEKGGPNYSTVEGITFSDSFSPEWKDFVSLVSKFSYGGSQKILNCIALSTSSRGD